MDREIIVALIAAGSGVTGAIIGFLATYFTKVRELKQLAQQKRQDAYVEILRQHIESTYVPLSATISKLARQGSMSSVV